MKNNTEKLCLKMTTKEKKESIKYKRKKKKSIQRCLEENKRKQGTEDC